MEHVRSAATSVRWLRLRHAATWPLRLRGSPIGLRLFLAFQVIILLTGLIGVLAVGKFNALVATTTELDAHDIPEVAILGRLRSSLFDLRRVQSELGAAGPTPSSPDTPKAATVLESLASDRLTLVDLERAATGIPRSDLASVTDLIDALSATNALAERTLALAATGQTGEARALSESQLTPLIQKTLVATETLRSDELDEAAAATATARQEAGDATRMVLFLTILSVILSAVLATLMTRSLVRPLTELLHVTEAFAAGNLEASPRVVSRDELGRLARAFDTMREALRRTIASLERERQQTQAIIDATADGLVLVDSNRRIRQMNPAAERLSGWSAPNAIGRPCWEVFGCRGGNSLEEKEHEACCPLLRTGTETIELPTEVHARTRDGRRRWLAATCAPVPGAPGDEPCLVVGFHDISQLKVVDQMKSDFVAMVSHELRAPVTTVAGAVETLALLDHTRDGEEYGEVVAILQQQTRRLQNVVAEVLQLTRLEAGRLKVRLEAITLIPFLEKILDGVRLDRPVDERPMHLSALTADALAWADPGLLDVVLRNLIDNARKYTPANTSIEVEVSPPLASGTVQIRVRDHGPGIPPDQGESIFDRFARGPASTGTRGYGLGLYIARELMKAMNGEIWIAASDDGACFVLSLVAATDRKSHLTNEVVARNA